jgi:signal transduction histidine kinase
MQLPSPVDPVAARFAQTSLAAWLAAAILLGIFVSILVARRLVTPLSRLAEVVESAGVTGTAMAMPASGPREIQAIIEAFNRMQGRLSRFVEDRTRMIAAISHDLKTPLTRLQLRMESPDVLSERHRMLADLHAMGEMIDSVISFAQEDTKREPRLLVDVATLVEGICDDAADAGQSVTFSGARGVAISCRPIALRRAISNLVDNAIKYGTNATVHLAQEPERVVITIDDDGPGIPPSQRDKVFEPFYRQERSRTPRPAVSDWAFRSHDPSYGSTMGISASPIGAREACTSASTCHVPSSGSTRLPSTQSPASSTDVSTGQMLSGPARSVSDDLM